MYLRLSYLSGCGTLCCDTPTTFVLCKRKYELQHRERTLRRGFLSTWSTLPVFRSFLFEGVKLLELLFFSSLALALDAVRTGLSAGTGGLSAGTAS